MMYISNSVLLLICFGCLSFGAFVGAVVISLCRISSECSREEEEAGLYEATEVSVDK